MKAMLLAAGRGERLWPLTDTLPKCMVPFQGKPLLAHWLDKLRAFGVTEIAVNVHHLADTVMNHFGNGEKWGVRIFYSREETLLGTAGALLKIREIFDRERFLTIYADSQSTCDLSEILAFHASRRSVATMSVCQVDDPRSSGIVSFDATGRIERFLEKPRSEQIFSRFINAGIYVFEPEIFDYIPGETGCDFSRDVFPAMLARKAPLYAFAYNGYVFKFDTFEDWKKSEEMVRNNFASESITTPVAV